MQEDFEPLASGTVLDAKWRIEAVLGVGGMAAVYRATHVRNRASMALKVLHPALALDRVLRERFLLEGYAANAIAHPGVVQVHDDGQTPEGHVFLVMELLIGETVEALAQRHGGLLPLDQTLKIATGILSVLAVAHEQGTVHRDIKPENLFVTRDGVLKILDFGLATIKQVTTTARLTVTGVSMGTPAFMPPEQALADWHRVDVRSDVYAVGATLWNLLTGKLVHQGDTVPRLLVNVSTRHAPPIATRLPTLPAPIAAVIDRALRFERDERWANARAMLLALEAALGEQVADAAASEAPTLPPLADATPAPAESSPPPREQVELAAAPVPDEVEGPTLRRDEASAAAGPPPTLRHSHSTEAPVASARLSRPRASGTAALALVAAGVMVGLVTVLIGYVATRAGSSASPADAPSAKPRIPAAAPTAAGSASPAEETTSAPAVARSVSPSSGLPGSVPEPAPVASSSASSPTPPLASTQARWRPRPTATPTPPPAPSLDPLGTYHRPPRQP